MGVSALFCTTAVAQTTSIPKQPNIIWLMAEDIGQDLECYGLTSLQTPNLNLLAQQGVKYNAAVCTNPISSPNRSAMMTGVHQVVTSSHNHRSHRNTPLEEGFKPFTYYLRESGYTCILGHHSVMDRGRKTDCNFQHRAIGEWNGVDSFGLFDKFDTFTQEDQPFFAQIQLKVTHRGDWWRSITDSSQDPVDSASVELPPFMPDQTKIREQWASYLDQIEYMDSEVGMILDELKRKGLIDNTIIFFIGDNGRCDIRGKGYLYEPGIKIPMIAWGSGIKPFEQNQVVSVLDITATILTLAGVDIPSYYHGKPLFDTSTGESLTTRDEVYSARDTWDEVVEAIRSITTKEFKYIRNYLPQQGWDMHQMYLDFHRPALHVMRNLDEQGELSGYEQLFMAKSKPIEELYDLQNDPYELHNLAENAAYADVLDQMRNRMDRWQEHNVDRGLEDINSRTPEVMPPVRRYTKERYPELWHRITQGEIVDNYVELTKEAQKYYK